LGIQMLYPSGWEVREPTFNDNQTTMEVLFESRHDPLTFIRVSKEITNMSLNGYTQHSMDKIQGTTQTKIMGSDETLLYGLPARNVTGMLYEGADLYSVIDTWTVKGSAAYRIAFYLDTNDGDYSTRLPNSIQDTIDEILSSFRITSSI
jgi:hypothetical protein